MSICKFGVEENHSFVHYLKMFCHQKVVIVELITELLNSTLLYLYDETVTSLLMLRGYNQIIVLCDKYLNMILPIAKLMQALILY